jgi:hypothetical protein
MLEGSETIRALVSFLIIREERHGAATLALDASDQRGN